MAGSTQQWELFGYDMRRLWQHWLWAWREFLWGDRSPVRARLDEVVRADDGSRWRWLHVGEEVEDREAACEAVLLPDDQTLVKSLRLPRAAEDDLASAMRLEVQSSSPFPPGDTASGWRVGQRDEQFLTVSLCIVSRSAVMRYLGEHYGIHDPAAREVWSAAGDAPVMLQGFGEGLRLGRYNARLRKVALLLGGAVLLLIASLAVAAGGKYIELHQYQSLADEVQRQSRDAVALRESLAGAGETVRALNEIADEYPSPHAEVVRMTELLGDGAYLSQFTMDGRQLRLRGRASNAAAVMEELTANPRFAEVSAPQGIVTVGTTGMEQFTIDIELARDVPAGEQP